LNTQGIALSDPNPEPGSTPSSVPDDASGPKSAGKKKKKKHDTEPVRTSFEFKESRPSNSEEVVAFYDSVCRKLLTWIWRNTELIIGRLIHCSHN
jgi:hypothetical protein